MAADERTEAQLFNESLNAKLAEAEGIVEEEEPDTPEEPEPEAETVPEPETPDEGDTPADKPEERLYAGKYKSVEDLERAVAHQEEMIARQSNEVGDLRQAKAQLDLLQQQLEWAQAQPDEQAPSVVQDLVDRGRYQEAANYALQANPAYFRDVMNQWYAEEPYDAQVYHGAIQQQQMMQQMQGQMAPQMQQTQQYVQQQELAAALDSVSHNHDDFVQVIGGLDENRLSEIIQGGFPSQVLQGLGGTMQEKQAVFETLYRWAKADQAGNIGEAATQAVQRSQQESRSSKQQAAVASATTGASQEPPLKSEEEQIRDQMVSKWQELADEANLDKAWTGRDSRGAPR